MDYIQFGFHLTIDLYNCDKKPLEDFRQCYSLLNELPKELGMKKLTEPYLVVAESNNKKDPGGISGFVIIAESHISLHTFVNRGFVSIDVYSCKEFDHEYVIEYFKKHFGTDDVEYHFINRGSRYPTEDIY